MEVFANIILALLIIIAFAAAFLIKVIRIQDTWEDDDQ